MNLKRLTALPAKKYYAMFWTIHAACEETVLNKIVFGCSVNAGYLKTRNKFFNLIFFDETVTTLIHFPLYFRFIYDIKYMFHY